MAFKPSEYMNQFFCIFLTLMISCCHLAAENFYHSPVLLEAETPIGKMYVFRPTAEEVERTSPVAKAIFQEAFSTTYRDYHQKSGSTEPIEKWLRLKEGLTLESWLSNVYDGEYEEYLAGSKEYIYFCHEDGSLIGWMSHGPLSDNGDVYLSQCAFEKSSRHRKAATTVLAIALKKQNITRIFPGVKELKLITRKINKITNHLFVSAGFTMDETIDPSTYGDSYDDRYVGYRLTIEQDS